MTWRHKAHCRCFLPAFVARTARERFCMLRCFGYVDLMEFCFLFYTNREVLIIPIIVNDSKTSDEDVYNKINFQVFY